MTGPAPLPAADVLAIHDLYARYAHAVDSGVAGACAECFTEDGTFTRANGVTSTGHDELRAMAEGLSGVRHLYANLLIEATSDGASGRCYNLRLRVTPDDGPQLHTIGLMSDTLVRADDGWLFRSRTSTSW